MKRELNDKLIQRLYSKFVMSSNFFNGSYCWDWLAYTNYRGYGEVAYNGKKVNAYKLMYELFVQIVPEGLVLDHLCRRRICVNPDHLEPVTQEVNMSRGANATKTHCKNGHEFAGHNLMVRTKKNGKTRRQCRTCTAVASEAARKKRRASLKLSKVI
jgi:hypothetical protein